MARGEVSRIQTAGQAQGPRKCSGCGQQIPSSSKLSVQDGERTLCLACQIREAQTGKGLRH